MRKILSVDAVSTPKRLRGTLFTLRVGRCRGASLPGQ